MRLPRECYQMQQTIGAHLPHLSPPQLTGLTWWVCGTIWAGSPPLADQNAVAAALSCWGNWNRRRQYLRQWLVACPVLDTGTGATGPGPAGRNWT